MKAKINGLEVEGTINEIVDLVRAMDKKPVEDNPTITLRPVDEPRLINRNKEHNMKVIYNLFMQGYDNRKIARILRITKIQASNWLYRMKKHYGFL